MRTSMLKALGLMMSLVAAPALAGGLMLSPEALRDEERSALSAEINRAKRTHPELFARLASLRAHVVQLDAMKRGRLAPVSPWLKGLGPQALWPMLEMLAFDAEPRGDLRDSAWLALRVGLVEAVGMTRDARAVPVLAAILDAPQTELELVRPVSEALGRIGTDSAVTALVRHAEGERSERQLAVLSGAGSARRLRTTQLLASSLDAEKDESRARVLAKALGDAGNAGAWRTSGTKAKEEEAAVRGVAARSLIKAFVRFEGEARIAASNALMVVDAPTTPALLREESAAASPALRTELDALSARFATNPTRIRR